MYDKRWLIENYFKELKNRSWNFKNFPSTDPKRVRNHLIFGMISFSIMSFLKHLWRCGEMELDRFIREFIRVSVVLNPESGPTYVPSMNKKSEEIEFIQNKTSLDDLYGCYETAQNAAGIMTA